MSTVAFHTLGCKVNHYETEAIWQLFKEANYERVDFEANADVFVINTCTVTNTGDKKSRQIIRRAIRQNPDAVICVTGCYAQTSSAEIMEIPGVDVVVGTQDRHKLLGYIDEFRKERQPINGVGNIMKNRKYEELDVPYFTDRTRASLKIQEGCNNFCTFCIIPWARGLMRSRDPEKVVEQATQLVNSGYKEIVLTGIHTGGYGQDLKDYNLAQLLRDLETINGLERIRISSIEASQLTDEVIVGFPGETEAEFQETYDFIVKHKFSELHVFPYSPRIGTPAARMDDQIDEEIKNERVHKLITLSNQLGKLYASKFDQDVLEVIPEEQGDTEGTLVGYADNYMKVQFEGDESLIGQIVKVKITQANYPLNEGQAIKVVDFATNKSDREVLV
ncbi:TPA: MiaB/RimO family radical SAM methylthiotransferase [Staphylococcus aureus]|nr:MiaB/RimO family radical SAM methylthiotransferase [Staphylococcus aureus]